MLLNCKDSKEELPKKIYIYIFRTDATGEQAVTVQVRFNPVHFSLGQEWLTSLARAYVSLTEVGKQKGPDTQSSDRNRTTIQKNKETHPIEKWKLLIRTLNQ